MGTKGANYSLLGLLKSLDHCVPLLTIFEDFGSNWMCGITFDNCWTFLDYIGSAWNIFDHFGPRCAIFDHPGLIMTILDL